jgi:long-chain acyl-CoA synthetase
MAKESSTTKSKPAAAKKPAAGKPTVKKTTAAKKPAAAKKAPAKKPAVVKKPAAKKPTAKKTAPARSGISAKRPWLKEYPAEVPENVDTGQYSSLVDLLEDSFKKYADRDAYVLMDKALTYADLDRLSQAFGAYLQSLGLAKGDRVAVMLPNILQSPVAVAAVLRAGFILVNVNPLYTERELEHQLKDSGSKALVILENFAHVYEAIANKVPVEHVITTTVGGMLGFPKGSIVDFVLRYVKKQVPSFNLPDAVKMGDAISKGESMNMQRHTISRDDVAVLQYTGGTTGVSKGATLLHDTLIAALLASDAWVQPGLNRDGDEVEGQMISICALPLYHVFAFVSCSLLSTRAGGLAVLIPNPRDLPSLIKEMSKYKFHTFPAVNTLFNGLANHPDFAKLDFSQLRISNGGGMAVTKAVAEKWLKITGCPICEGYGLSETSSGISCNPTDTDVYTGTVGLPMPGVSVRIVDEKGKEVAQGERGEIAIKGPQVMQGYWQRPDATKDAFTKDGYFLSGDIGVMEKTGYFSIVDRKKDMILVSGFNVFPNEVEDVIGSCPGVLETACVGVPDEATGEAIMVFCVREEGSSVTEAEVRAYAAEHMTGYKKPRYIEFVDELPKTNVGKVLRRELRDDANARALAHQKKAT